MMTAIIGSTLVLAAIGWMIHINANDRRIFEKELDDEFGSDPDR